MKGLIVMVGLGLLVWATPSMAAGKAAHIGYVYPAGGRQGNCVTVIMGGENVYGARTAWVSGRGVTAEVVDSKDPNEGQLDPKKKNRKKNEAVIDELITVKITIAPDAEPGDRDICLATTNDISNKLIFQVGQIPEIVETEPDNNPAKAVAVPSLPVTVQGQIMPGDVDGFKFTATKGQRLVVQVAARALLPYIADGVPGWFQAIVALSDPHGRDVAVADDYRFNQDPVLFYDVPEDGEYKVFIRDSIYRGRQDFVYRMRIGELPFVSSVFPLGAGMASHPVPVRVAGVNLPGDSMAVAVDTLMPATRHLVVTNHGLLSNPVLFAVGDEPEVMETQPALKWRRARTVSTPVVVNGCLSAPGDKHYYRFSGQQGEAIRLVVMARRLGSPLDSVVTLFDSHGRKLAQNDDVKDKREGYLTHQSDSELAFTLPAQEAYTVEIRDAQGRGGDEYAYRLRIGPPAPDFDLRMIPAAVLIPRGGSVPITLQALRRDGFSGDIRLGLQDPSGELRLDGAIIPGGVDRVTLTLTSVGKGAGRFAPRVFGVAAVAGRSLTREALPSENLMQAFLYQHLLPFREETVVVTPSPAPFRLEVALPTNGLVDLPLGREVKIPVTVARRPGYPGAVRLQLVDGPTGVSLQYALIPAKKESMLITLKAGSRTETNRQGTIILSGTMQVEREATAEELKRMAEKAAREKKAREEATATPAVVVSGAGTQAPAPLVTATNLSVAQKEGPVMVKRPVTLLAPAFAYRIIDNPERKASDATQVNSRASSKPNGKP